MTDLNQHIAVWRRTERAGLFATIAWFVGAAIFLNAIIFSFGVDRNAGALDRISWAPPGWAVGAIWVMLFSLYAVSHWLLLQRGESGRRAARWVLAIAAWDLAYPLLTNGFDLQLGAWLNVVTAFFTILLLWRVWRDSRIAFGWLLPSLVWVCFATVLTFAALQEAK
jgi:translocator protein